MSHEYQRRGKNWFTAIGLMFCIMATIVLIQQLLIWGPEFVEDFLLNGEVTNEKVSMGMLAFGIFMVALGLENMNKRDEFLKTQKILRLCTIDKNNFSTYCACLVYV